MDEEEKKKLDEAEKKKLEEEKQKAADGNSDKGDKSELVKETEQANAASERMEKATEELNAAEAKRRLGGVTEAGQSPAKEPTEEDKKKAKASEFFKDTALGDAIDKT